jgi:hypothetical protein
MIQVGVQDGGLSDRCPAVSTPSLSNRVPRAACLLGVELPTRWTALLWHRFSQEESK